MAPDKPNPFQTLGLPTDATNEEIVARGQELCDLAESEEQRLLYRSAMEQLLTKAEMRLQYELFEIPGAEYEDRDWEHFARAHRRTQSTLPTSPRKLHRRVWRTSTLRR